MGRANPLHWWELNFIEKHLNRWFKKEINLLGRVKKNIFIWNIDIRHVQFQYFSFCNQITTLTEAKTLSGKDVFSFFQKFNMQIGDHRAHLPSVLGFFFVMNINLLFSMCDVSTIYQKFLLSLLNKKTCITISFT